jgi:hypothetical protein
LWAVAAQLPGNEVVVAYRDDLGRVEALLERVVGEVAELRAVSAGGAVQYPAGAGGGDFGLAGCHRVTGPASGVAVLICARSKIDVWPV